MLRIRLPRRPPMSRTRRLPTFLDDSQSPTTQVRALRERGRLTEHEWQVLYWALLVPSAERYSLRHIAAIVYRETGAERLLVDLHLSRRHHFSVNDVRTMLRRGLAVLRREGLVGSDA